MRACPPPPLQPISAGGFLTASGHASELSAVVAEQECKLGADEGDQLQLLHDLARMYQGWDPRDPQYERLNVPLKGDGIERDFVKAAKCYALACELFWDDCDVDADVADSAYELAKMYEEGRGVAQSYKEAERLLNLGVDKYHSDSKFHLACMLEEGRGVTQNLIKAADFFKELIKEDEDKRAYCRLASMHRDGRGVPQNKQEALSLLNHKSLDKNADASFLHASMLLEKATGSSKDPKIDPQATRLLKFAATQNHADSQYLLACHLKGSNPKQKIALLKGASKCNHIGATFKLACMLADGEGVACDDKEAAKLLMTAVAKGHVESHCRLADMFEHGKGVAQSIEVAAMLYGQAAEKKNASAMCNLARMHLHGHGVIQSHSEALNFCRLAAFQGFAQAQYDLACMYQKGVGTAVVHSEANRWFHEAAAQGHQGAAAALRQLNVADTAVASPESQPQCAFPCAVL
jgi:TPR repeat protein